MFTRRTSICSSSPQVVRLTQGPIGLRLDGDKLISKQMPLQAAVAKHTNIKDVLALFFRDDIIAWSARRSGRHASAGAGIKPAQLRSLVHLNVERTFGRLKEVRQLLFIQCIIFGLSGSCGVLADYTSSWVVMS